MTSAALSTATSPLVEIRGLSKTYALRGRSVEVLQGVDLQIQAGEMISLEGQSGAGKSTLLHVLGTLDTPTSGQILYQGEDVFSFNETRLANFRNSFVGFVFQFHHLLPEFTAQENVMMPGLIAGQDADELRERTGELLDRVGLSERWDHHPSELSGGEQQRVAIARSLIMSPRIVLADEPTGNLDQKTSEALHELLLELNAETGITFLVATHNTTLAQRMRRHLVLEGGKVLAKSTEPVPRTESWEEKA